LFAIILYIDFNHSLCHEDSHEDNRRMEFGSTQTKSAFADWKIPQNNYGREMLYSEELNH